MTQDKMEKKLLNYKKTNSHPSNFPQSAVPQDLQIEMKSTAFVSIIIFSSRYDMSS